MVVEKQRYLMLSGLHCGHTVKGFDLGSQAGKSATIQIDDVRIKRIEHSMEAQLVSSIEAFGDWPELFNGDATICWYQSRESIKPKTNTRYDAKFLYSAKACS